jgi:hypothetical protein
MSSNPMQSNPMTPGSGVYGGTGFSGPTAAHDTGPIPIGAPQAAGPAGRPSAVYRTKRTGLAIGLVVLDCVIEILMLRAFLTSALASKMVISGTIAGLLMIIGVPTFTLGAYAALGGAAAAPGQGFRPWLRTPLAYLPIGLALFLAAAIAAG